MSPVRRDFVIALVMSGGIAVVTEMSPPTVEDATTYIVTAVRRHHLAPQPRDDQARAWQVDASVSGCAFEQRTSHEVLVMGRWERRMRVARWQLGDIDATSVRVSAEPRDGRRVLVVTVPCDRDRACVETGGQIWNREYFEGQTRKSESSFEFTSDQVAQRVAAAFRHAAGLCRLTSSIGAGSAGAVATIKALIYRSYFE